MKENKIEMRWSLKYFSVTFQWTTWYKDIAKIRKQKISQTRKEKAPTRKAPTSIISELLVSVTDYKYFIIIIIIIINTVEQISNLNIFCFFFY